jgi:translation initiation factor eIF-2B subunit epsilon
MADREKMTTIIGKDSNAIVWPQKAPKEDEGNSDDEDGEGFDNFRLMRLGKFTISPTLVYRLSYSGFCAGDECSDLELSDAGSITDSEGDDSSDDDSDASAFIDASSSATSLPTTAIPDLVESADAAAEAEFRSEVKASLARAFAEGHSVDNAAVELKTLRMASNVPLERVKEAVIGSILQQIPIIEGAMEQRREIARVIGRWGMLINQIGGVDAVETISILQVKTVFFPLFYIGM